jgi:hypothetical protein
MNHSNVTDQGRIKAAVINGLKDANSTAGMSEKNAIAQKMNTEGNDIEKVLEKYFEQAEIAKRTSTKGVTLFNSF